MKQLRGFLLSIFLSFSAVTAQAAPLKVLFFFPGGQGDQQLAQPFLDSFSEALKKSSAGKIEAEISYISDPTQAASFITQQKPAAAILSQDVYLEKGAAWQAKPIARTLQLPSGDGTNQYFLIGKKGATLPASGTVLALTPQILDAQYAQQQLFPQLGTLQWQLQKTGNAMGELRNIGMGQKDGWVLLDQFEWMNVSRLRAAWVAGLAALAESKKVPSAPFVVFPQNISEEMTQSLQATLLKLGQDPSAQDSLLNLRMKGFEKI